MCIYIVILNHTQLFIYIYSSRRKLIAKTIPIPLRVLTDDVIGLPNCLGFRVDLVSSKLLIPLLPNILYKSYSNRITITFIYIHHLSGRSYVWAAARPKF